MSTPVTKPTSPHDPWLIARDRFINQLDPAERALFNEATPENLYYKSSNIQKADQKNSKTRAILGSLGPLMKSIQDYGDAMDTFTSIAPLYLAPIWGSIRVVLVLASNHAKFYDRIIDTFARIGDIIPRLRDYQAIFDQDKYPKFTQTLSAAYLDIIVLCSKFKSILTGQKASFVERLKNPLSSSLAAQLDNAVQIFREHRDAVENEAKMCHYIEAKESRELELRERMQNKEQERRDRQRRIISQMTILDCNYKHRRMQRIRHHGTGTWLASVVDYRNWRDLDKSSVMSCYGIPGSGKSVLVSSLIDSSKTEFQTKTIVAYYYCDYADKRTLSPSDLFNSISQKLFRSMDDVPQDLMDILEAEYSGGTTSPGLDQIVALLVKAIDQLPAVAIFIDGLDELPEVDRKLTFSNLRKILNDAASPVKLFVSSREDTTYLFQSLPCLSISKLHLQTKSISPDIDLYTRYSIDQLIKTGDLVLGNLTLKEDIFDVLKNGAQGMFLWVKFQLEELCRMETDAMIIKALRNLPRNLEETYDRLLGRIIEIERREFVKRMFSWILCSRRPLHMDELREAIAFTTEDTSWDATKIPNDLRRLIRACGNLILIDEDTLEVHLAHYTVEQYLLHSQNSTMAYFHTTREESNQALGETCVAYLSFTDFESQVTIYRDIINPNMTVLQEAVNTQPLILRDPHSSNLPAITAKASLTFQRFREKHQNNIDYSRYIQKNGMTDQEFFDKYRLIAYLKENWLSHTKDFTEEICQSKTGELFRNLLFHKQLTFSIKPWEKLPSGDCANIASLGWAVAENHLLLLKEILGNKISSNDRSTSNYISEACLLFWNTVSYCPIDEKSRQGIDISDESLKVLESSSLESICSRADGLFWLYSQIVSACRKGNFMATDFCVRFIDEKAMPTFVRLIRGRSSPGFIWGPSLRSLVFAHLQLEATIHGHFMLVQRFRAVESFYLWVAYEYKGSYFNALERAISLPHDEITDYLLTGNCPVSNKAKLDAMQAEALQSTVESGDSTKLRRLVKFLGTNSDFNVTINDSEKPYFGTNDQSYKDEVWKYKLDAIIAAASLGLLDPLHAILHWESMDSKAHRLTERKAAFLAAIDCSQLHIIQYLLFSDRYKDQCYWIQPIPSDVCRSQGLRPISPMKYIADEGLGISEELRALIIDGMLDASKGANVISSIPSSELSSLILKLGIAKNNSKIAIHFGACKHPLRRIIARDIPDIPHIVDQYLWPHDIQNHQKKREAVPLIWAVLYNQPEVVKALLSGGFPASFNILHVAATCAVMMDSVELVMALEEVRTFSGLGPMNVGWGKESNYYFTTDLIDRVFARGKYHHSKPSLKVARYIESWDLNHGMSRSSYSAKRLQENLKRATPAEESAITIGTDPQFISKETMSTPPDEEPPAYFPGEFFTNIESTEIDN
ncbi:hypothetical protein NHQ30_010200 [Ciborinia camelliae]|nr:hypothetical protein NHQ30_010200 [Ciborinia camelliae]